MKRNREVRKATNRDLDRIRDLVRKGLKEFGFAYLEGSSEADLQDIEREYTKSGGAFFLIEEGEKLVGTGAVKFLGNDSFKIRKMYVAKEYRGQGLGKLILSNLIDYARSRNAREIVLETTQRMTDAVLLYESLGFMRIEKTPTSPRCDVTMRLALSGRKQD